MPMRAWLKFIAIGSIFATVEEFLTVALLKRDMGSYLFTLLVLFPIFLSVIFGAGRLLQRIIRTQAKSDLALFCLSGGAGLMIEWFLIGLSPWSNANANAVLMLLFQLGMFSFWATVGFAPWLMLKRDEMSEQASRYIWRFFIVYFAVVYGVAFALPQQKRFGPVICLIILGYFVVCGILIHNIGRRGLAFSN